MAVVKYDVSDVEAGGGGEQPQPGTYPGKIVSMVNRKKKGSGEAISDFEVVVDIGQKFVRMWTYIKLPDDPAWSKDSHGWKLRELTDALGLPPKGSIDPKKVVGTPVLVKVAADTDLDGEYRGKVKNLFPIGDNAPLTDEAAVNGDGDGASGEGPYPREEIETWDDDDVKGYAEEIGAEGPTSGRSWKSKLIDAIISKQDEAEEAADHDASGDTPQLEGVEQEILDELKDDPAHYAEWPDEDIQWMVTGLGIDGNVATSGRGWKPKAIAAIVELAGGSGDAATGDDTDGEAPEPDDYDDLNADGSEVWPTADLKAEIAERKEQGAEIELPKGRVTREKLIELLREDNKSATPF